MIKIANKIDYMNTIQKEIYDNAVVHGFWCTPTDYNFMMMKLALMVTEIAELMETFRKAEELCKSDKNILLLYDRYMTNLEEELADIVIRAMDFAEHYKINLMSSIIAKHEYNKSRPFLHGKQS